MHRPIEEGLEDYLGGKAAPTAMKRFHDHLASCPECRDEVKLLELQSTGIRSLRYEADPSPGFYARVMERIEAQRRTSYWSMFLEPLVVRPIMYASFGLLLFFVSAVWSTGPSQHLEVMALPPMSFLAAEPMPVADGSDPGHDRAVVLTNLASFSENDGPAFLPTSTD